MADFCRQCSIELFDNDYENLKGLTSARGTAKGEYASVLCEGCGFIHVESDGNCVSSECKKAGHNVPPPLLI